MLWQSFLLTTNICLQIRPQRTLIWHFWTKICLKKDSLQKEFLVWSSIHNIRIYGLQLHKQIRKYKSGKKLESEIRIISISLLHIIWQKNPLVR